MRKRMNRILSVLLVSVLVFQAAEVAHAEDVSELAGEDVQVTEEVPVEVTEESEPAETEETSEAAEDTKKEAVEEKAETPAGSTKAEPAEEAKEEAPAEEIPEMTEATQKEAMEEAFESVGGAKISAKTVNGSIPVKTMVTGAESLDNGIIGYTAANVKGNYCGYSQKVTFSGKGTLAIGIQNASDSSSYIFYGVFRDEALTDSVDYRSVSPGELTACAFKIPAAGTYYIGLRSSKGNASYAYAASVAAAYYSGVDRTISNGKQIAVGQKDAQTNYFKFKAVADGYITVSSNSSDAAYNKVALLNSAKKALSGNTNMRYNPTYGVKKGTTYYIRVVASYNSDGAYTLKATNSKVSEKSGKKKSKAVTIKKGKTKKGTIVAGSSQADWYKFKLTKKKTVKIYMKGRTNDTFKITVYKGGKKIGSRSYFYSMSSLTLSSAGKWPKGTYYIKVQRANKTSSGWYSLKWK